MQRILLCCALLMVLALAPAAAQPMAPVVADQASLAPVQTAGLSVFLASLAEGASEWGGENGTDDHCPQTCAQMKAECQQDCLPCGYAAACYHNVCDVFCSCYC